MIWAYALLMGGNIAIFKPRASLTTLHYIGVTINTEVLINIIMYENVFENKHFK